SRHKGDYRDIDKLTNPSISRDRSEYDRPRARDRDRYRNRSRSRNLIIAGNVRGPDMTMMMRRLEAGLFSGNAHHGNEILPKLKHIQRITTVAAAPYERKKQMLVDYMAPLHTNCNTNIVLLPQQGFKNNFRTSTMKQAIENAHEFGDQVHVIDVENSSTRESNNYKIFQVK
ncbi:hypothetical protein Tco_1529451, partial [Tanacetum coccineum]